MIDKETTFDIIGGEKIVLKRSDLEVKSVDKSMKRIASRIAYYSCLLAKAERNKAYHEVQYRRWRAKLTNKILESEPKLAEYKVTAKINAHKDFLSLKQEIATAEYIVTTVKGFVDALHRQSYQLPSIGARKRAELDATGMTTKEK